MEARERRTEAEVPETQRSMETQAWGGWREEWGGRWEQESREALRTETHSETRDRRRDQAETKHGEEPE